MRTLSKAQGVLFIWVFLVIIPISAYGVDGQRKLTQPVPPATFPIVINQEGSYVLTSNLVVTDQDTNAITILVNDVTLDLNGHKIQGPGTAGTGTGINAENKYSITIKNGRIWGFGGKGISIQSDPFDPSKEGAGHWIDGVQALNNGSGGIGITSGIVTNCTANNNNSSGIINKFNSFS